MSLFQTSVVKKYLNELSSELIDKKYNDFQAYFGDKEQQERIRDVKEEQFQEGFLRELFVKILGYTINPDSNFNLTTEIKNVDDSKKADGAILANNEVHAVIELKSTQTTDLDTVETQAFNYKNHHPKCQYVITSNFEKIRLYIQNAIDKEEFDLFNLTKERFALLWICFAKDNLINDIPLKIKEASVLQEESVTKKLYNDYSKFREVIFNNIVKNNPAYDKLVLFKKTQKLLDRFLFIFFAEDRLLLPPNSISEIVKQWITLKDDLDEYKPLYERFKKYFGYLNTGYKGKKYDIFAYNGGLFAPDEILDNIIIDDDLLHEHTLKLSSYDFETEVDVNILGHIFEHSLGEIENVQAEIKGEEIDKQKTKRKKDGIFYTPKYITKYIVENTIGKLCEEKRKEFGIIDEEYAKGRKNRKKDIIRALDDKLSQYRDWLLDITILDPACGSGAFLNQALEFLIQEHKKIDELKFQLLGGSIVFSDIEATILEKNIFGVDLNEESVEIAKLSLWLRTAQKGRKLTTLSKHIKCGNSLIDDPEVAGEKAFHWQNEFPEVFAKGGFDVVIGNPPYVRQELFKDIKPYLKKNYTCYNSIADLYTYFIEKGINLIKSSGLFSFILPNKFLKATYGIQIRKVIKDKANLSLIFDFDDYPVFEDATTYPIIFVLRKKSSGKGFFYYSEINKRIITHDPIYRLELNKFKVSYDSLTNEMWNFIDVRNQLLLEKIIKSSTPLRDVVDNKIFAGIASGKNDVFITKNIAQFKEDINAKKQLKLILGGSEISRYSIDPVYNYILFIPWDYDIENSYTIKEYLSSYKNELEMRPEVKTGRFNWWCLSRYGSNNFHLLNEPKIIAPFINNQCNFYLDTSGEIYLQKNSMFISSGSKSLLAFLNSKISFFYLKNVCTTLQGGYYDFRRDKIQYLPVPTNIKNIDEKLVNAVNRITQFTEELSVIKKALVKLLKSKYSIEKPGNRIITWYKLDFKDFLIELKRYKVQLSLSDEAEWMQYFNEQKEKAQSLKSEIDKTDKEIDQMVYELYGLTQEEIAIVEGSTT